MKSQFILGLLAVVILLGIVAWMFLIPSESTTVLAPTPEHDGETPTVTDLNQFIQQQPDSTPLDATPSPVSTSATQAGATVEITDTGFVPATLKIKSGTTVTFVNHGQGQHWPASGPHPTHTGLPGFDSKTALATGDAFTFTFSQVGTWPYHDHLSPSTVGSIVVE